MIEIYNEYLILIHPFTGREWEAHYFNRFTDVGFSGRVRHADKRQAILLAKSSIDLEG